MSDTDPDLVKWPDIGYVVRWASVTDHFVGWEAYELDDFDYIETGEPLPSPDFEGYVKWDGCTNWGTTENRAHHTCTRRDVQNVGELLLRIRDTAAKMMPRWDGDDE
jgi:hypothetical protein